MSHSAAHAWLVHRRAAQALAELQRIAPQEAFVVVKSVALAARYGWDSAELPIADVDVRMPREAYLRLRDRLRAAHDPRIFHDSPVYGNLVLQLEGHMVDIESTCGPPYFGRLRVEHLLRRAELAELDGAEPFLVPDTTDHALLLTINWFKDGVGRPTATSRQNLLRIVAEPLFDLPTFVRRARWTYLHTTAALVAAELAAESPVWRAIAQALGPVERPLFARLHARTRATPDALLSRLIRRAAVDEWRHRGAALGCATLFAASDRLRRH